MYHVVVVKGKSITIRSYEFFKRMIKEENKRLIGTSRSLDGLEKENLPIAFGQEGDFFAIIKGEVDDKL